MDVGGLKKGLQCFTRSLTFEWGDVVLKEVIESLLQLF